MPGAVGPALALLSRPVSRAWIAVLLVACSRDNPGFVVGDEAPVGSSTAVVVTTSTASTDAVATTAGSSAEGSSSTGAGGTTVDATTGEPLPVCPAWSEPALDLSIDYGGPLTPPQDCGPQIFKGRGILTTNSLTLQKDAACGDSLVAPFVLEVGYVALDYPIPPDTCFVVKVGWNEPCDAIRSVVIWAVAALPAGFVAAGVVGSAAPPAGAEYLAPTVAPVGDEGCACGADPSQAPPCCDGDGRAPGGYQLDFESAGVVLRPGEEAVGVVFPGGDEKYRLMNLRSHVHPECEATRLHLDWFAIRN